MSGSDTITVLECAPQLRLAKLLKVDGTAEDYDSPRRFTVSEHPVSSLTGLHQGLIALCHQPQRCLVRAAPINGPAKGIRRLLHRDPETGDEPTLREIPRRWLALDLDGIARPNTVSASDLTGCARAALSGLPSAFRAASCVIQATAGHGRKPGSRLRLWFWLDRPVVRAELEVWFAGCPEVDPVSFRPAQVIYTAAPVFETGLVDHLPARIALLQSGNDVVVPPAEMLTLPPRPQRPDYANFAGPIRQGARWVDEAFARGVAAVASAPIDARHNTTLRVAFNLACLVHEGGLNEGNVRSALGEAIAYAGKEPVEAHRIFDWAMGQASGRAA